MCQRMKRMERMERIPGRLDAIIGVRCPFALFAQRFFAVKDYGTLRSDLPPSIYREGQARSRAARAGGENAGGGGAGPQPSPRAPVAFRGARRVRARTAGRGDGSIHEETRPQRQG